MMPSRKTYLARKKAATKPRATVPTEDVEQRQLAQYLNAIGAVWLHVPNAGQRSYKTANWLKSLGLKPGAPDVLVFSPPKASARQVRGVAIELKRQFAKESDTSPEQHQWLNSLHACGWAAVTCRGATEAIKYLQQMGY